MRKHGLALFAALALFGATGAAAQAPAPVNAEASITIPTLLEITVDETTVLFGQPTLADYTTGHVFGDVTSVVSTRGNVTHDVTIVADAPTMTFTPSAGGTDPQKPATDLQWSIDNAAWSGLSTTAANVAANLAKGTNAAAASVTYRMLLNEATDEPGLYTLGFTYTVVAN
ncbi:MAG TPA: hypothetical protein VMM83_04425 [Longimicrobiales bacterium]|nr:hypothetical protein [Longimicrobiales bacterium]